MSLIKTNLIMILIIIILPAKSFAMDVIASPFIWLSWWTPYQSAGMDKFDISPGILYGGALSMTFFNSFSTAISGSYGSFTADYSNNVTFSDASTANMTFNDITITRADIDLTFSYKLSNYFKAFCGIKYQEYNFSGEGSFTYATSSGTLDASGDPTGCMQLGLGGGLGFSYPISESFSFSGTLSYLILAIDLSPIWISQVNSTTAEQYQDRPRIRGTAQGGNSVMLLSYLCDPINTTFSIGYRFQMVYLSSEPDGEINQLPDTGDQSLDVYDGTIEYFHGVLLYATYHF